LKIWQFENPKIFELRKTAPSRPVHQVQFFKF
jgi:hypothetical protein